MNERRRYVQISFVPILLSPGFCLPLSRLRGPLIPRVPSPQPWFAPPAEGEEVFMPETNLEGLFYSHTPTILFQMMDSQVLSGKCEGKCRQRTAEIPTRWSGRVPSVILSPGVMCVSQVEIAFQPRWPSTFTTQLITLCIQALRKFHTDYKGTPTCPSLNSSPSLDCLLFVQFLFHVWVYSDRKLCVQIPVPLLLSV